MKHTGSYIIAAIWILIALALCGVLINGLSDSDMNWNFFNIRKIGNFFDVTSISPVDTETIETSYSVDSVKDVKVDLVSASFSMSEGSVDKVVVKIITNVPESRRTSAKLNGSTLEIKTPKLIGNNNWFESFRTSVEIIVPSSFNKSGNASSRSIDIDSVSGSISIEDIKAGSFDIDVVSGSIKLSDVESKSVSCDSVSGSIFMDGAFGAIDVESVSGSINVKTSKVPESKSSFETVSGSILLSMPDNDGFTLDYTSVSGSTENEFTGFHSDRKSRSGKDTYKNGGVKISSETISGSIRIKKN